MKWDEKIISFKPDTAFQNTITLGSVMETIILKNFIKEIDEKLSFLKINKFNIEIDINVKNNFSIKEL